MRIRLDENLPSQLAPVLTELDPDVDTVPSEGITGKDDAVVWQAAQASQRFLITQDLDFSDVRHYAPGTHHGLLLVRLPEPGRTASLERVATLFHVDDVKSWGGCIVIATPHKIRVRR